MEGSPQWVYDYMSLQKCKQAHPSRLLLSLEGARTSRLHGQRLEIRGGDGANSTPRTYRSKFKKNSVIMNIRRHLSTEWTEQAVWNPENNPVLCQKSSIHPGELSPALWDEESLHSLSFGWVFVSTGHCKEFSILKTQQGTPKHYVSCLESWFLLPASPPAHFSAISKLLLATQQNSAKSVKF